MNVVRHSLNIMTLFHSLVQFLAATFVDDNKRHVARSKGWTQVSPWP